MAGDSTTRQLLEAFVGEYIEEVGLANPTKLEVPELHIGKDHERTVCLI